VTKAKLPRLFCPGARLPLSSLISFTSRQPETSGQILLSADAGNTMAGAGYGLPMELRIRMIRDCCAGVAFLHSRGLVHCDIKSLNFLVTNEFTVKLSDLGEARPLKGMTQMDRNKLPK
jgi:serine/threonine protein kinase